MTENAPNDSKEKKLAKIVYRYNDGSEETFSKPVDKDEGFDLGSFFLGVVFTLITMAIIAGSALETNAPGRPD